MNRWREKALVRRIAAGEREACARLIRDHHAPVYRLLAHLCRDEHLAEDLTQETFAAAWTGIGNFNGDSSLATWLHRIAYRKFVDWRRRERPVEAQAEASAAGGERPVAAGPLEDLLAGEQARRLHGAIARLGPADAEVITLHYLQGLSYAETAAVLELPVGSVKGRTSHALDELRMLLRAEGQDGRS